MYSYCNPEGNSNNITDKEGLIPKRNYFLVTWPTVWGGTGKQSSRQDKSVILINASAAVARRLAQDQARYHFSNLNMGKEGAHDS